jgi:hypothetical protein
LRVVIEEGFIEAAVKFLLFLREPAPMGVG